MTFGLVALYLVPIAVIAIVAAAVGSGGSGDSASASSGTTLNVTLSEFAIKGDLSAPAGDVTINVTNAGSMVHNLYLKDPAKKTADIQPGKSATLKLGNLKAGEYELYCNIAGHKDSGMKATLTITEGGSGGSSGDATATTAADASHGHGSGSTADDLASDKAMNSSFQPYVDALTSGKPNTEGKGGTVLQPTSVDADGTKNFELTIAITKWEVTPGKVVDAWAYNGMVPGPMFKLNVGDKIAVTLHNKLPVSTDIHWHGIETPFEMDGVSPVTQDAIQPNQDFTYRFSVDRTYQGMYHPHIHGQEALPNGAFGVIQVGDTPIPRGRTINGVTIPKDLQLAVDRPMVLNDAGVIGLSLDGKGFPSTEPIVVKQGDWVAITYYNEGLQIHPMHLHEFPVLVVAKEGFPLEQPYWADTTTVGPGERLTVMFHADKKGIWAYHCHILNHAESATGMMGMVTTVAVM